MSLSTKLFQSRSGLRSMAQGILRKSENSTWSAKKVGKLNSIDKNIDRCPDIRMGIPSKEYSVRDSPYLMSWDDKYHPTLYTSKVEHTKEMLKKKGENTQQPKSKWLILPGYKNDERYPRLDDLHYKPNNNTLTSDHQQEEILPEAQPVEARTNIWTSDLSDLGELKISRSDLLKKYEAVKIVGEYNPEILHHNLKKKKLRESRTILSSIRRPKITKYTYRKYRKPCPNSVKTFCPVPCYWEYWRSTVEKSKDFQDPVFVDETTESHRVPKPLPNKVKEFCPIPSYSEYLRNTLVKTHKVD